MTITIYHNPACGTSRNVLALLRASGQPLNVVEYLTAPPSRAKIVELAARSGQPLRQLMREKGTPFAELGLGADGVGDAQLLDAIAAHPILLNRPLVETKDCVSLCRPSDVVLDLLPQLAVQGLSKGDGAPFLRSALVYPNDSGFVQALAEANLPVDDLADPDRVFYRFTQIDGTCIGYGGLELYGQDAFLRSIVVTPGLRNEGLGRNLVTLLLYRAYEQGGRRAWLLTLSAAAFFERLGFKPVTRENAPAAILNTRQARGLCPGTAVLLSRKITF